MLHELLCDKAIKTKNFSCRLNRHQEDILANEPAHDYFVSIIWFVDKIELVHSFTHTFNNSFIAFTEAYLLQLLIQNYEINF